MEEKIWVTSDLHFGHNKDFLWRPRGFNSIEEHDREVIKRWNEIVNPNDTVYVLGDLMLGNNDAGLHKIEQLMGNIRIIIGNHDTDTRIEYYLSSLMNVVSVEWGWRLRYKGITFYMSHYPSLTSNYDEDKPLKAKVVNLCGHSHTSDPFANWDKGLIFHTELDTNDCRPWLLDDIIIKIKEKFND